MERHSKAYFYRCQIDKVAETGWRELKTTKFIRDILEDKPLYDGFGSQKVGLVYRVGTGSKKILLRADIDALQTSTGVAHICGHSTHAGALMSVYERCRARLSLINEKDLSVYFVFQPAEETFPSGASAIVKKMQSDNLTFDAIYSAHVRPLMRLGFLGLQSGAVWARGDYFEVECHGVQRHIKDSDKGQDAIFAAAKVTEAIKSFHNKHIENVRWSVGTITGGRQPNTVADYAKLTGDVRMRDDSMRGQIQNYLAFQAREISNKTNCRVESQYYDGYPSVSNDEQLTARLTTYVDAREDFQIATEDMFSYGCEDFGFYSALGPICMAFVGTGDRYDIHEDKCTISPGGTAAVAKYFCMVIDMLLA